MTDSLTLEVAGLLGRLAARPEPRADLLALANDFDADLSAPENCLLARWLGARLPALRPYPDRPSVLVGPTSLFVCRAPDLRDRLDLPPELAKAIARTVPRLPEPPAAPDATLLAGVAFRCVPSCAPGTVAGAIMAVARKGRFHLGELALHLPGRSSKTLASTVSKLTAGGLLVRVGKSQYALKPREAA